MPTSTAPETRKAPKAGDAIHVLSDSWGRENGAWYPATVTEVTDALVRADVVMPTGETVPGTIVAGSDHWRWPSKG